MKKIYIASKMTGAPDFNRPRIRAYAEKLKREGFEPLHTAEEPDGLDYMDYIKRGIKKLTECDEMHIIGNDWQESKGVNMFEIPIATKLMIPIKIETLGEISTEEVEND